MSEERILEGIVKLIGDTQEFDSGFTKREFVVTTDEKFPQDIKMEMVKDKTTFLDKFCAGDAVRCKFNIRGNEYKDKYYVNLTCWFIESATADVPQAVSDGVVKAAEDAENSAENAENTDPLPF